MEARLEQFLKASTAIEVMVSGNLIEFRVKQSENAACLITFNVLGNVTEIRL